MGSKNRIFLGYITSRISHFIRNTFEKELYITDVTAQKIKKKHSPLDKEYVYNHNFQIVINNTIMIYPYYDNEKLIYNCLSKVEGKFLIYGMISKDNRTEVSTLFIAKPNQIKKKFIDNKDVIVLKKEEFITN